MNISWKRDFGTRAVNSEATVLDGAESVGWDGGFAFDVPGKGWDKVSFVSGRKRLSFRARDLMLEFASSAPIRYVQAGANGAFLGPTRDSWIGGGE